MQVVTGAFGYIGRYIARRLLLQGEHVRTITTNPDKPNPFGEEVQAYPLDFSDPQAITDALRGATTLYNTYWIRFEYGGQTFDQTVENTATLFDCALKAGVQRVVHISVTRASLDSPLAYYRGKAQQEQRLKRSGMAFSIVRPTLVFGDEDILVNNIAWLLRKFPFFPVFGDGKYRLQPVFVRDLAQIAIESAAGPPGLTVDARGPETYTFQEMVRQMANLLHPGVRLVHLPPGLGIALGRLVGYAMRDVLLTKAELDGLMTEMLTSDGPPTGETRFSDWLKTHHERLGTAYTSELGRHFNWGKGKA